MFEFIKRHRQILFMAVGALVLFFLPLISTLFSERNRPHLQYNVTVPVSFISEPKMVNGMHARVVKVEWDPVGHKGETEKFYFPAEDFEEVPSNRDGVCLLTMVVRGTGPFFVVDLPLQGRDPCPSVEG